ncbi:tetratricopeptide repeat protein 28-like [Montipora foliosa]|uniref:tetratricopeptide repeat protein 28-like n=1 Tax=Montipora foliosa TaxID=591990 RepID=UPI0035F216EC
MAEKANGHEVTPVAHAGTLDSDEDTLKAKADAFLIKGNETCRGKDFSEAIRLYTEGIEVNCKDELLKAKLYSNRAKAYFSFGNYIYSLEDAKVATELQPSFVLAYLSGARACFELREFEEAVTWCDKGLAIDNEKRNLLELKERSLKEITKSQDKAEVKDASKSSNTRSMTEVAPEEDANDVNLRTIAELFKNEGDDELKKKDLNNAIHLYSEGIKVRCKDGELKAKLYRNRSAAHFKLGNYNDSLRDAKIAVELQPSFVKTIVRGARACVQLNRLEEAITWCDKGLEIDKNNQQLLELRISFVEEQGRRPNLQGKNKMEDLSKTETRKGANVAQFDPGTINRCNTSGKLGGSHSYFNADIEDHERKLKLAEETGDKRSEGLACVSLGNAYKRRGNFKKAKEYHERDHEIAKDLKDLVAEGRACCNIGNAYFGLGDFKRAISYHTRDLQIAKDLGDVRGEGIAYSHLGVNYCSLGYFKKAIDYHERSLEIATSVGDTKSEGNAYGNLGSVYYNLGDFGKAVEYHDRSLQMSKDINDVAGEGEMYCNLGSDYHRLGDLKKAIDYHKLDLEISQELGNVSGEGSAYCNIGNVYHVLGDFQKALVYHERHLQIAKVVGDVDGEGTAYNNLGADYLNLGDFTKAKDYLQSYLTIVKKVGNLAGEGMALGNLATIYQNLGDSRKAVVYLKRQLEIAKDIGNLHSEGTAYGNLGIASRRLGDLKKAIHYHERQLEIAKNTGVTDSQATACCNLGNAYMELGDFQKAINFLERALDTAKQIGNKATEGKIYGNFGNAYYSLGNIREAIRYHELHLKISTEVGDVYGESKAYGNLGAAYHNLGDFRKAIDYDERLLEIAKRIGDVADEGVAYANLGNAYDSLGDFKQAIEYHKRDLEIAKKLGDISGEGVAYGNLGNCYHGLGDFQKAVEYYEWHLKLAKNVGDKANEGKAYGSLGSAYDSLGNYPEAIEYHERCKQIAEEMGDKAGKGIALGNLGRAHYSRRDFTKAIEFFKRFLEIAKESGAVENEGKAYSGLGVSYFHLGDCQKAMECHDRYMEISKRVGDKVGVGVASFNRGEVYQALGSLSEATNCYHQSVAVFNDVRSHLGFNDEWKMSLRDTRHTVYVSLWYLLVEQGKIMEAVEAAEQGRAQALKDLLQLNYASEEKPTDAGTTSETLDDLLECIPSSTVFMALVKKEVFFWVFQKGKAVQFRRKEIESCDHETNTFLLSLMKKTWKEIDVRAAVKCEDRSLDVERDVNASDESSSSEEMTGTKSHGIQKSSLHILNEIIIDPIKDTLYGDEVVFVPEGPLCLAPFAAFMNEDSKYLGESFRVRVIPSLTSLKLIADCPADYHSKTGALLVGDPWVQEVDYQGCELSQLPCAREEVQMIGRILGAVPLIGEQATKEQVLKSLSSVALVHIAAHGKMGTGEIALAPNPSRKTQVPVEEDFLLTMRDVLNVQMRAQLVVLSCCHSARGEIKAEGVVGIARAFLGAGARSVLVSLWAIDDDATLGFMKIFYQLLLCGKSASEALNQTMKCMRESDQFQQVKHWAPFVLIGDDVTLVCGADN